MITEHKKRLCLGCPLENSGCRKGDERNDHLCNFYQLFIIWWMSDLDWFRLFSGEVPVDDLDLDTWTEQKGWKNILDWDTWLNDQAKWFIISSLDLKPAGLRLVPGTFWVDFCPWNFWARFVSVSRQLRDSFGTVFDNCWVHFCIFQGH